MPEWWFDSTRLTAAGVFREDMQASINAKKGRAAPDGGQERVMKLSMGAPAQRERYEFAVRVLSPEVRQAAAGVIREVAGDEAAEALMRPTYEVELVRSRTRARELAEFYQAQPQVPTGFDFETKAGWSPKGLARKTTTGEEKRVNGVDPMQPDLRLEPLCFQIWRPGLPVHVVMGEHLDLFAAWLKDLALLDISNFGFESTVCWRKGFHLARVHRDPIHMDYLGNETLRAWRHGQKDQERDHLGLDPIEFEWPNFEWAWENEFLKALEYCSFDPLTCRLLGDWQQYDLSRKRSREGYGNLWEFYQHAERSYTQAVVHHDQAGMPVVPTAVTGLAATLEEKINSVTAECYAEIGRPVDLSSNKVMANYFYREKGYPVHITADGWECLLCGKKRDKRTNYRCPQHGGGAMVNSPKVDESALEPLAEAGDKVAKLLLKRRGLDKQRDSFVEPVWMRSSPVPVGTTLYPWADDAPDMRVMHPSFNASDVVSGRLSAPLALTLPKKGFKHQIGFRPGAPWRMFDVDINQGELRVLAERSRDPAMVDAFDHERDMHAWTGALAQAFIEYGTRAVEDRQLAVRMYEEVKGSKKIVEAAEKAVKAAAAEGRRLSLEDIVTARQILMAERRGHGKCFHPDTELLTKRGWVRGIDVDPLEPVIQAWPLADGTSELEWAVPDDVGALDHPSGQMVMIRGETVDMGLVPDHRTVVSRGGRFLVVQPGAVERTDTVPAAGVLVAGREFTEMELAELRVAVAVQADGSYEDGGTIVLSFRKDRKVERLSKLLAEARVSCRKFRKDARGYVKFVLPISQARRVKKYLTPDKRWGWDVMGWSLTARALVVEEVRFWDGSDEEGANRYSTKHEQCADVIQAAAATTGRRSRRSQDREWWRTRVSDVDRSEHSMGKMKREVLNWEGTSLAVTVPSTYVLCRFKGTTFVSGNTVNFAKIYGAGIPTIAQNLGVSRKVAEQIVHAVDLMYAGLISYAQQCVQELERDPVKVTLAGRHRTIVEVQSQDPKVRAEGERLSLNQEAQAGLRDIVMGGIIQIDMDIEAGGAYGTTGRGTYGHWVDGRYVPDPTRVPKGWEGGVTARLAENLGLLGRIGARVVDTIHDEALGVAPEPYVEVAARRVVYLMEDPWGEDLKTRVPFVAEGSVGVTWQECKDAEPLSREAPEA
jgi:DNA polymerase I-like protein with 3'-5' exonuclease and polymerase domains